MFHNDDNEELRSAVLPIGVSGWKVRVGYK